MTEEREVHRNVYCIQPPTTTSVVDDKTHREIIVNKCRMAKGGLQLAF